MQDSGGLQGADVRRSWKTKAARGQVVLSVLGSRVSTLHQVLSGGSTVGQAGVRKGHCWQQPRMGKGGGGTDWEAIAQLRENGGAHLGRGRRGRGLSGGSEAEPRVLLTDLGWVCAGERRGLAAPCHFRENTLLPEVASILTAPCSSVGLKSPGGC